MLARSQLGPASEARASAKAVTDSRHLLAGYKARWRQLPSRRFDLTVRLSRVGRFQHLVANSPRVETVRDLISDPLCMNLIRRELKQRVAVHSCMILGAAEALADLGADSSRRYPSRHSS
jgi:hypothetical protein